ncbi:sulfurtransferase TusA family protein [Spirochaetia bacterium 38H-sp]|uniref:Sulfurtransferase TusA family protein n=1 Tax=Rarispira pelagica TaxID=3141764 RepID=A0ABU9U9S7_9SPIR
MPVTLPKTVVEDIATYKVRVDAYLKGKLGEEEFKTIRVPMGVYEQRKSGSYMVRIRVPAGDITPDQLIAVSDISSRYTLGPIHITTRQELQIHNVSIESTPNIMEELIPNGLSSRGGGGNTVRNIIADPFSWAYAAFDILPYANSLSERLLSEKDSWTLPRKFKICFGSSLERPFLSLIADIGIIPVIRDSKKGFAIYLAGGLGTGARIATKFSDFIPTDNLYAIVRAVKEIFDQYGNRRNKHRARLRFLVKEWGESKFIKKIEKKYEELLANNLQPLSVESTTSMYTDAFLELNVDHGYLKPEDLFLLGTTIKKYEGSRIRLSHRQNVILYNIKKTDLNNLLLDLKDVGFKPLSGSVWESAVACAGASTCRLGVCLSGNLLTLLQRRLREQGRWDKIKDLVINISGCPNNCAHTLVADIGLAGAVKRKNDVVLPAYTVYAGANLSPDEAVLADRLGTVPAESLPDLLEEVFVETNKNRKNETFYAYYIREGRNTIKKLVEKYESMDAQVYTGRDIYETSKFSLLEKLEGECSAGLFDLIEMDIREAEEKYKTGDYESAVVSASRALLITKGIEERDRESALKLFLKYFAGKHVDSYVSKSVEKVLNGCEVGEKEAKVLIDDIKRLYNSMDNSLKLPELTEKQFRSSKEEGSEDRAGGVPLYDYRGVPCPINFVKAKLALDPLEPNTIVEFLLDDGQPIENVPASLIQEGHQVLSKENNITYWKIRVKRG